MKRLPLATCRAVLLGGFLAASGLLLRAQDAMLTPVQWAELRDPPEELPVLQGAPRVEFPAELRETADIGYVVFEAVLDPRGRVLDWQRHATAPAYLAATGFQPQFTPGKRAGKGVNSAIAFAAIFNPASAHPEKPDAAPRLLEVDVVRLPLPKGAEQKGPIPNRAVLAEVSVDASGRVTQVKQAPAELAAAMAIAAKNWRFAPARRGGQAVAADVRVPFGIVTGAGERETGPQVMPKAGTRVSPIYPLAMRASGMRGEVLVEFLVDIEGRVRNPVVVRSLNPSFDDPAITAVRQWQFEPGRIGRRPVTTRMQVPIIFQLSDTRGGGADGMMTAKKADLSKVPEALRYDTPPRLTGSARPVFPYALLHTRQNGRAVIRFFVDERGRVIHAVVGEATHPEFGLALRAAVEQFTYEPALKGGQPNKAIMGFIQEFTRDEAQQLVSREDLDLLHREEKRPQSIVGPGELDGKLTPISQRAPWFPLSLAEKVPQGEALVEFIVDEEGRARLPRVVSASDEAFGYAAVQGVASWRFEPPTRGGRAVAVRVKAPIRFRFATPPPEAAPKN